MALNHPRFSTNGTGKHPEAIQPPLEERSRRTAEALATRYEQLNRLWSEAEARLKAIQVPRYVWVPYASVPIDPLDDCSPCECECLGLVKYRGEWRLCRCSYVSDEFNARAGEPDQPTDWKPISDCSVEERVAAAAHIGKLRERIVVSAEHYIAKVDDAVAHLTRELSDF